MLRRIAFAALALIATAHPAAAQLSGPLLLDQNGNVLAQRPYWQFLTTGGGTVCKATTVGGKPVNQCATPQGGGGTLQGAYNNSAGASPSILETGGGGAVDIQGPAGAGIGAVFRVRTTNAPDLLTISDNGASQINASGALNLDGGSAINIGGTNATAINVGRTGVTTAFAGTVTGVPLQQVYNNSAGANPSILETAANGAVTIKGPAVAMGTLFLVQDGVPNNLLGISDNGASRLDSVGALNLGTTTATSIAIGPVAGGSTTTVRGGLTQQTGAVSLTGNAASSFTTSAGALTITSAAAATWSTSAGALTMSAAGQLSLSSGIAAGATPAFNFNNSNTFGANLNVQFQDVGINYIAFTRNAGNPQINLYNAVGALDGALIDGGTAFRISSWSTVQPGTDLGSSLGQSSVRWNGVYSNALNSGAATALTITGSAASTWSTSAGLLTISGTAGMALQSNGVTFIGIETQSGNIIDFQKNIRIDGGINLLTVAGTTQIDFSSGTGLFKTTTGANTFGGSSNTFTNTITLSANAGISGTAGTGALALGTLTGDTTLPTGSVSWTAAATKTLTLSAAGAASVTSSGAALTLTAAAASTWSTSSGALTVAGSGGINLDQGANLLADVGVASATAVTISNTTSVNMNAAAQGTRKLIVASAPTISAGFGTGVSVTAHNGTAAFRINVGTSSLVSGGTIGLPTATNGWNCFCTDLTTADATRDVCKQTGGTSSTAIIANFTDLGAAAAFADNDIVAVSCFGF